MDRHEVVRCWKAGIKAKNSTESLWTDGVWLYSYNLKIGLRQFGKTAVFDYTARGRYVSVTTSTHVGIAKRSRVDIIVNPLVIDRDVTSVRRTMVRFGDDPVGLMIALAILGLAGVDGVTGSSEDFYEIVTEAFDIELMKVQEVVQQLVGEIPQYAYRVIGVHPVMKKMLLAAIV